MSRRGRRGGNRGTPSAEARSPRTDERLRAWEEARFGRRLWAGDHTLWSPTPQQELTDRLGWLTLPEEMTSQVGDLVGFSGEVASAGIERVVLLGMGGSSLAPEVFQRTFGNAPGHSALTVLDSTHPSAVRAVDAELDPERTLFVVSSKSGTTTETLSLFRYFWRRLTAAVPDPGRHFVAITDPGTPLARLAGERGFRRVFVAPEDVGGRYSALSVFGLVPAALIGVDVRAVLDSARRMAEACGPEVAVARNPGLWLGGVLGEHAIAGQDKVTFSVSRSLAALPSWIEQLIAESTGKDGRGIVPVCDEPPGSPRSYGRDRLFILVTLGGDESADLTRSAGALAADGHPVMRFVLDAKAALGGEYFRWEVAVAAAGAVLGIHPFNQPDVQLAKDLAQRAMRQDGAGGAASTAGDEAVSASDERTLAQAMRAWMQTVRPGDYVGIQAYLAPSEATWTGLQEARGALRERFRAATTLGYGPRFLHSTGQLHKGGPNTGAFLQLIDDADGDVPVPETDFTFGGLIRAQAAGDYRALRERGRRVLRLDLGRDPAAGLARLIRVLRA